MAAESKKDTNRPWTTEEIIENANTWSLAGDVALFNTIKSFSNNLLVKTEKLRQNIDNLLNNLDEVGLKLDISQNQFHSLKNTQFIESRVYEDDETLDSRKEEKVTEKPLSEEEQDKIISESINAGLEMLDKYYDIVELSISDSEDEQESSKSFVLKPKDTYAHRPLPPVIGTDEWYKKWNSEESSSDNESNKMSDVYSESESEDNLPKDLFKGSETSSELEFSSQTSENRPVANSTFNDSITRPDLVTSNEDSIEPETLPVSAPISNKSFAEQLAARLDSVISKEGNLSQKVNKERIQPAKSNTFSGNLFSDEPPPLNEPEDEIFSKTVSGGLFSGGQNLFDDNDDLFANNAKEIVSSKEEKNGNLEGDNEKRSSDVNKNLSFLPKSSHVSRGLFDSDDSSDDGIFSTSKPQLTKVPCLQSAKPIVPLFDDEPPVLEDENTMKEEVKKKKPTGAVSIFGSSNLFGDDDLKTALKNQQQTGIVEQKASISNMKSLKDVAKEKMQGREKKVDLFADETEKGSLNESKNNLFDETKPKKEGIKSKINLFDDDDDVDMKDETSIKKELLQSTIEEVKRTNDKVDNEKKHASLFDDASKFGNTSKKDNISLFDDDDDLFKDDLFSNLTSKKFTSNLFDDLENSNDLFSVKKDEIKEALHITTENKVSILNDGVATNETSQDPNSISIKEDSLNNNGSLGDDLSKTGIDQVFSKNDKLFKLFDDEDDADLFDIKKQPSETVQETKENISIEQEHAPKLPPQSVQKVTVSLFDSTPPPDEDDDDWDTKSDHFSDTDEPTSYRVGESLQRSSLFDEEPPSLGPDESSGIVRDNSTRIDTDDSSFHPYASSSRRLSTDLFGEQQLQDSFFVTKSGSETPALSSNLDNIQEDSKISVLDLTPSGNLDDLDTTEKVIDKVDSENNLLSDEKQDIGISSSSGNEENISKNELSEQNFGNNRKPKILQNVTDEPDRGIESKSFQKSSIASITDMLRNESEKKNLIDTKVSPGKLKHSMNINVNALKPGYFPQKTKELSRSESLNSPKNEDWSFAQSEIAHASSMSVVHKNVSSNILEKAVSFDDGGSVEVLHSVTKDRAKIPIKRKPSTRRGRQALRKLPTDGAISSDEQPESGIIEIASKPAEIPSMKTPTLEDDLFGSIDKISLGDKEKNQKQVIASADGLSREQNTKKNTLFGSGSETEDDLFGASHTKKSKQDVNVTSAKAKDSKKSLFDDDDSSGDDLFSSVSGSSATRKSGAFKSVEKKTQKPSTLKKLENITTTDDPLSNLLK